MFYECELIIDLPRETVIEYFDSFENLVKWQPGLQTYEPLSGEFGQPGAKTRLVYDEDGRKIEMIETIVTRDLPDEFSGTYEAKGVFNTISNHFYEQGADKTRWVMKSDFQFSGMYKFLGVVMKSRFPKETMKQMKRFKEIAEDSARAAESAQ